MEADECVLVLLIGEGGIGHAGKLLVEDVLVVLERWIEKLVEGGRLWPRARARNPDLISSVIVLVL